MTERFHIVTGGPGSGKTSVIEALAAQGFLHMPEAGRAIIRDQVDVGGDALPWANREAFAALMLAWEMRSFKEASVAHGPVLFDRGIPDVIGYFRLSGLSVPASAMRAAELRRYAKRVFIAPPWPAIFVQDTERKQDLAEAEATYRVMAEVYAELGYEPVLLPLVTLPERAAFIRSQITSR